MLQGPGEDFTICLGFGGGTQMNLSQPLPLRKCWSPGRGLGRQVHRLKIPGGRKSSPPRLSHTPAPRQKRHSAVCVPTLSVSVLSHDDNCCLHCSLHWSELFWGLGLCYIQLWNNNDNSWHVIGHLLCSRLLTPIACGLIWSSQLSRCWWHPHFTYGDTEA